MTTEVYLGDVPHGQGYSAVRWCADTFGPGHVGEADAPTRWYLKDLAYVVFESEKDAMFFILRWVGCAA